MKKLSLILMTAMSVFIFSCKKETVQPMDIKTNQGTAATNQYNETNSKAVSWSQLPEDLRNAEIRTAETTMGAASKINASYLTQVGPWGGSGGSSYAIYPTSSTDKIYAIGVRSGSFVDGLSVWYIRTNGTIYSYVVGGTGGTFFLQSFSPTERITAIAGRSGGYLDRLTIYTTTKSFSYGGNGGSAFYAGTGNAQILGFYGGAGTYVDRIGAYIYSL